MASSLRLAAVPLAFVAAFAVTACNKKKSSPDIAPPITATVPVVQPKASPTPKPAAGKTISTSTATASAGPKLDIPGGTSLSGGDLLTDGTDNTLADDLGLNNDNSGFSLTDSFPFTLTGSQVLTLTLDTFTVVDDNQNDCTITASANVIAANGSVASTVALTTDSFTVALPGTLAA